MKYLNLGCGYHFSTDKIWSNLDFVSTGKEVVAHNLLKGIPYPDNTFHLVYHSHVLEHFSKNHGYAFIKECHRVLKPGGIIRIAIPDLEQIVKNYLHFFEKGLENPEDDDIRANYNWMLLEMYDQTVRNNSGGEMAKYIYQDEIINENFIYQRIGEEGRGLRNNYLRSKNDVPLKTQSSVKTIKSYLRKIKDALKSLNKPNTYESIGRFRLEGEIHQWMYDRYSLSYILKTLGFNDVQVRDAFSSYINNWSEYELDGKKGIVRKPDSLFIEAIKI